MKRLLIGFLSTLAVTVCLFGQDDPDKAVKKAGRSLSSYNLDPLNNKDKLMEAKELINFATASNEMASNYDAWQKRGEIYNAVSNDENAALAAAQIKQENYQIKDYDAPLVAFESFKKALSLAEKKYETRDALKGLTETLNYLNVYGNQKLSENDFAGAYQLLDAVLSIRDILMKNGEEDVFKAPEDLNNHRFVVAFCAYAAGNREKAKELFKMLYEADYDEPRIYSNYYNILSEEGDPNAIKVLEKGRAKYPNNSEILFAEINEYIKQEKYDVLEAKLKEAIAREPENPSIYSALGNVYMNLHQTEYEAGNKEKATEYYDQSIAYFNKALEIDPTLFDAVYSIGSVHFNKAVEILKQMNDLGLSKEEQKKYDMLGKEVDVLFDKALPYFKKAEKLNPNDRNTLIALREIYARQNDLEKSKEFKERLEKVEAGGVNETPYFNE